MSTKPESHRQQAPRHQETVARRARERPPLPLALVGYLGGAFLGGILLFGAWAKAIHPSAFVEQIEAEGLAFLLPATVVAAIALALEAGLGTALVLGVRKLWVLIPSALLVLFFLFLTGRSYYRFANGLEDPAAGCGCFGNLVERTPAEAFWQDLLLMVPALLLAFFWRRSPHSGAVRAIVAGLVAAGAVVLGWKAPSLPLDDLATRLKPGVEVARICTGSDEERLCLATIRPELASGRHLVVIASLEDERWGEWIDALNEAALEGQSVLVLSSATPEQERAFFWQWGPAFEIVEAPDAMLQPLVRAMPRSFEVRDGEVVATWSGLPPVLAAEGVRDTAEPDGNGG